MFDYITFLCYYILVSEQQPSISLRTPYTRWERCIVGGAELAASINAELDIYALKTIRSKPADTASITIVTARQFMSAHINDAFDNGALAAKLCSRTRHSPLDTHEAKVIGFDFLRGEGTNRKGLRIALLLAAPAVLGEISEVNDLLKNPPYNQESLHVSFRKIYHPGTIEQMATIKTHLLELVPPVLSLKPMIQKQVAADGSEVITTIDTLEKDFRRRRGEQLAGLRATRAL